MDAAAVLQHIPAPLSHSPVPRCPCVPALPRPCVPAPVSFPLHVPAVPVSLHPCVPPLASRRVWASTGDSSVLGPCAQQWLRVPRAAEQLRGWFWCQECARLGTDPASTRLLGVFSLLAPPDQLYPWIPGRTSVPAAPVRAEVTLGACSTVNPRRGIARLDLGHLAALVVSQSGRWAL